jgi:hypothetical protein
LRKSAFGHTVIARLDALLKQPGVRDAMAEYYASWLDDESRQLVCDLRKRAQSEDARHP